MQFTHVTYYLFYFSDFENFVFETFMYTYYILYFAKLFCANLYCTIAAIYMFCLTQIIQNHRFFFDDIAKKLYYQSYFVFRVLKINALDDSLINMVRTVTRKPYGGISILYYLRVDKVNVYYYTEFGVNWLIRFFQ